MTGSMEDVDLEHMLEESAERWRSSLPGPRDIDPALFDAHPAPGLSRGAQVVATLAAATVIILVVVLTAPRLAGPATAPGGASTASNSANTQPAAASVPLAGATTSPSTGCGPSDDKSVESPAETGTQFGFPLPKVIMSSGTPINEAEARAAYPDLVEPGYVPPDLQLQLILLPASGSSDSYVAMLYSAKPIGQTETDLDFYSQRGLIITQGPTHGRSAAVVKETVGEAAQIVKVGPYDAALVHDSPWANGVRPYHLYWSDGKRDFRAGATTTPAELVDVARSIYCSQ